MTEFATGIEFHRGKKSTSTNMIMSDDPEPLHVAVLCKAPDIVTASQCRYAGARITARLTDGKAPLHLA